MLRGLRPVELVDIERKRIALELLADVRRIDDQLEALVKRIGIAVVASGTTVTDVYGIGPWAAAIIVGHTGDVTRFPSAGHYARYNATAPLEASSGPRVRHRLNPRGNRQLNHALHVAAITQVSHDTPGRDLLPPQDRGRQDPQRSTPRVEATNQRRGLPPARRRHPTLTSRGPGGQTGTAPKASVAGSAP